VYRKDTIGEGTKFSSRGIDPVRGSLTYVLISSSITNFRYVPIYNTSITGRYVDDFDPSAVICFPFLFLAPK
jgi:hypothetical protein